ncbi:hypothetical protein NQ318_005332 [Aromia moschata]|uniref:Uncharacterized protein n=1 Tax=Aromia moschata TaxID=1265417 RepID=A0AAV8XHM5_9CUCU|nr:hypothetical protein NQ318_005332 [Aromia moschata]
MDSDESLWEDAQQSKEVHLYTPKSPIDFLDYFLIATDYTSIPIYSVAILADVLLMIVVLKYKRLRNRNNLYLLNFAVFHTCYIISTPLFYKVLDLFYERKQRIPWFCVWIRVEDFLSGLTVTFGGGYGIDALLEKIRPFWFYKYEARYLYLFSFLYFSHLLLYVIAVAVCHKKGLFDYIY